MRSMLGGWVKLLGWRWMGEGVEVNNGECGSVLSE